MLLTERLLAIVRGVNTVVFLWPQVYYHQMRFDWDIKIKARHWQLPTYWNESNPLLLIKVQLKGGNKIYHAHLNLQAISALRRESSFFNVYDIFLHFSQTHKQKMKFASYVNDVVKRQMRRLLVDFCLWGMFSSWNNVLYLLCKL